ncbi:MAG: M28 family peptidase [Verrucomicrobia bacterium]|nr:M28 family peptidase [Verrucomicrobiota bacterium]
MKITRLLRANCVLLPFACLAVTIPREVQRAAQTITADGLMAHIRVLASDEFEGRAPGTPGEEKTVKYLVDQFAAMGLQPGNPDGTWFQAVPLVGMTVQDPVVAYRVGDSVHELAFPGECTFWTKRVVPEVRVADSEVVFVGYGVVAPEYEWDDFKDVDVRGKTLLMLVGDPPVPDPRDETRLDDAMFKGRAMTYYGRWTYKFEIAAAKGAAAAIIVHEQGPAGYPWLVVVGSGSRENFDLAKPDRNLGRTAIEGWIPLSEAKKLCGAAGFDYDTLKKNALNRAFRPVPLGAKMNFSLRNAIRDVASRNVVARLEGADPKLREESVVITAHWDHLGRDPRLSGDQIYNGALDNASGTAGLIEVARAFRESRRPPLRSVLFLAVTAEEKGLLGAQFYAENPLHPIARTVANLNMDGLNPWGRTGDLEVIGWGQNSLEDWLGEAAQSQRRTVSPDSEPEKGRYYRSDHFEFAQVGVPALYFRGGTNALGRPVGFQRQKTEEYTARDYHKVSDEIKPDWDLWGAAEDVQLIFQVAWRAATDPRWPEWKPGSEFKARREAMLAPPADETKRTAD